MNRAGGPMSSGDMAVALAVAHARYWTTVAPTVRAQIRRWYGHAEAIEDRVLRRHAVEKLRRVGSHAELTATLYTIAPRSRRRAVTVAGVALQVMYDYLDAVTERDVDQPLRNSRELFRCFFVAITPGEPPLGYYRHHPQANDSGYLDVLADTARRELAQLPALDAVLPTVRKATERFTEGQARSHATTGEGVDQLERWAMPQAHRSGLAWWEWAAGAAASILSVHALLSAAADARTTQRDACQLDVAYMLASTLTTLLDSLIDDVDDQLDEAHRYVAYYPTTHVAATRITEIATRTLESADGLRHRAHHRTTVVGIAAFYLSAAQAATTAARAVAVSTTYALGPTVTPALAAFRTWRRFGELRLRAEAA